jgi:hypothetical protein
VRSFSTLEVISSNLDLSLVQLFHTSTACASTAGPVKESQRDINPVFEHTGVFDRGTLPLQLESMFRVALHRLNSIYSNRGTYVGKPTRSTPSSRIYRQLPQNMTGTSVLDTVYRVLCIEVKSRALVPYSSHTSR